MYSDTGINNQCFNLVSQLNLLLDNYLIKATDQLHFLKEYSLKTIHKKYDKTISKIWKSNKKSKNHKN